jgi:serine/threonine-protein kinase RsbW
VTLERSLPATPESADSILQEIMGALEKTGVPCGDLDEVRLALREALNNAIKHGSRLDPKKTIHVAWRLDLKKASGSASATKGNGFDPNRVPDPPLRRTWSASAGAGFS